NRAPRGGKLLAFQRAFVASEASRNPVGFPDFGCPQVDGRSRPFSRTSTLPPFDDVCAMSRRIAHRCGRLVSTRAAKASRCPAEWSVSVVVGAVEPSPLIVPRECLVSGPRRIPPG